MILVDAGPLVALISAKDTDHERCVRVLEALDESLYTIWPPVAEAMHLLGPSWPARNALLEMMEGGLVSVLPLEATDVARMRDLMSKYRDLPMDFADAGLVCVAEKHQVSRVFTLDKDFHIYRARGIGRLSILPS